jgi:ribosomal protein L3
MEDANRRIGNIVTCVCLNLEALMKRMNKNHESIGSLGKATKVYQTTGMNGKNGMKRREETGKSHRVVDLKP